MDMMLTPAIRTLVALALEEDLGRGDVTAAAVLDGDGGAVRGILLGKQPLVLFGLDVAAYVCGQVSPAIRVDRRVEDGTFIPPGTIVGEVHGPAVPVLMAERTMLNFLQRLSGVATQSRRFADAVAGTPARVVDTRKTTPGWRALEKAAVVAGGCANHRADLGSGILIKDNHIAACGGVRAAVERARSRGPHPLRVEVEVKSLAELDEALDAGAEIVLLDNMSLEMLAEAIPRAHGRRARVEVSGGITLDTVGAIARLGPDLISAGAITHSAPAADISLDFA
jgi:nicotinate-nucleotide pyrophosphorylase (carboxylating)